MQTIIVYIKVYIKYVAASQNRDDCNVSLYINNGNTFHHCNVINCLILSTYGLIHQSVLALQRHLKLDQSAYNQDSMCAPTPAHSDAEEPRVWWCCSLSFHRNCHLRSHTGSSHIGSQLWCHLIFLLLCECQSEGCVPHWDTLFYTGRLWNSYSTKKVHPYYLTSRKGKGLNKCCWYLLQIQYTNERKVRPEVR